MGWTGSHQLTGAAVHISFYLLVQSFHASGLKSVMVGAFTPEKLANTANMGFLLTGSQLLNTYQHISG